MEWPKSYFRSQDIQIFVNFFPSFPQRSRTSFCKLLKRSRTSFCCTCFAWFFYKMFFIWYYSYLFSFSGYQTECFIEFLFRQLMTSWTLRFIFNHPPKQWLIGRKKREGQKYKKLNILRTKELFRWSKKHFS